METESKISESRASIYDCFHIFFLFFLFFFLTCPTEWSSNFIIPFASIENT